MKELSAAKIPVPLKSRPGVQLITNSGIEFEYEQYDILISALPNNVLHSDSGKKYIDLRKALLSVNKPTLILQPEFEPEKFRDIVLKNLGVAELDATNIPPLSGLRPDIVFADTRRDNEYEIRPDGSRRRLDDSDKRIALIIIDLKNVWLFENKDRYSSRSQSVLKYIDSLLLETARSGKPMILSPSSFQPLVELVIYAYTVGVEENYADGMSAYTDPMGSQWLILPMRVAVKAAHFRTAFVQPARRIASTTPKSSSASSAMTQRPTATGDAQ